MIGSSAKKGKKKSFFMNNEGFWYNKEKQILTIVPRVGKADLS